MFTGKLMNSAALCARSGKSSRSGRKVLRQKTRRGEVPSSQAPVPVQQKAVSTGVQ
jgi:hypothetical protein